VPAEEDRAARAFYERAYSPAADDGVRFGAWRAITGAGKAERVLRVLLALPGDGVRLLDVGCGDGAVLARIAARRSGWVLAGAEIADAAARLARERLPGADVRVYDGARLPWPDASFDAGLLAHVLEHVADPPAVLREVARVCRLVVVEVPLEQNLSARRAVKRAQAGQIGHLQRLSRADVQRLVRGAGLELREELTDTLTRDALRFFAEGRTGRRRADAKWAIQRVLHRCAPATARRIFTVQYVALCAPRRH
jgi:SAM-dependent methyltransferase